MVPVYTNIKRVDNRMLIIISEIFTYYNTCFKYLNYLGTGSNKHADLTLY